MHLICWSSIVLLKRETTDNQTHMFEHLGCRTKILNSNFKFNVEGWDWSNSLVHGRFSLHVTDLGLIPGIPYNPFSTPGIIPEGRTESKS